ncbi:MAG: sigma 54-interacting transcriptional regulator, partial [Deltaproteobacteria bacterium]|nr:sigma 54-interacting transcriptional regulator [Deltaproteobacteria bacterium]
SGDGDFGLLVLLALREAQDLRGLPVVMLTERAELRDKASAADGFLPKKDIEGNGATELDRRVWRHALLDDDRPEGDRLVGKSVPLLEALRETRVKALDRFRNIAMFGETGTGKEELARYLHHWARRDGLPIKWTAEERDAGVVKIELYGTWGGGHNTAPNSQPGKVEQAHKGTLLIDEFADLTPPLQGLLIDLRRRDKQGMRTISRTGNMPTRDTKNETVKQAMESVIGELEEERKGGRDVPTGRIKVDLLLVSATNIDLWDEEERKRRRFRVDLLNDVGPRIVAPSLNETREDIPLLFRERVRQARERQAASRPVDVGSGVDDYLRSVDWKNKNVVVLHHIADGAVSTLGPDFDIVELGHVMSAAQSLGVEEVQRGVGRVVSPPAGVRQTGARTATPLGEPPISKSPAATRRDALDDNVLPSARGSDVCARSSGITTPSELQSGGAESSPATLEQFIDKMLELVIPAEQAVLKGALPRLQEAYARLVLRMLGAALRAREQSSGESTLEAVRLLLDRKELRPGKGGDATKAYDVVKWLVRMADTSFHRRAARDCPVLSDDELVKEHVKKALER